MKVYRRCLKALAFCVLLGFFYFYFVQDVYEKYHKGLTNMADVENYSSKGFKSPIVTFCFPHNFQLLKRYNFSPRFFHDDPKEYPQNISLTSLFMESSMKLNKDFEILIQIKEKNRQKVHLGTEVINDTMVKVEEIPTPSYGLCYSLETNKTLSKEFPLLITVKVLGNFSNFKIMLSDSGYQFGLPLKLGGLINPWVHDVNIGKIKHHDLDIQKVTTKYMNCDSSYKSQYHCFASKVFNVKLPQCNADCVPLCLKAFTNLALPKESKTCDTMTQDYCVWQYRSTFEDVFDTCLPNCDLQSYKVTLTKIPHQKLNAKSVSFGLLTTSKVHVEHYEYLIYDTIGLIGNVGGSLGLFIGFSFFDVFCKFVDHLCTIIENKFP